ncbi:TonB-dependent siderophore receptor [Photobacterium arenosum]|uniref:TonB-dependent siderophore receptor n=1 Tax=Photobacterium arenosum TaxID=2774143 RepID=UPI0028895D82|nr:TonB-dependent siderophore receptor [Photobacterium arenosum]
MTQFFKPSLSTLGLAIRKICHKNILPISLFAIALPAFADEATNSVQDAEPETIVVTASTLKVEAPLAETPRTMAVVDQDNLEKNQFQKLDEALRYQAGVLSAPYGSDTDTDWFKVRGFDAATYLDGNRLFTTGYYVWTLEPFGLERVEILKGPASVLYGEAPPGGVVNAISKRPTDTPEGNVQLQTGNRNLKRIGVDISDYANEDGDVRYRIVGLASERDGTLDGTYNNRYYFAPSLTWDMSDDTSITFLASYKEDEGVPTNGFFPAYGTLIDTPQGKIDPSTNLGEPDYDINNNKQISLGYELSHTFNDVWSLKQNARYAYTDLLLRSTYAFGSETSADLFRGLIYRDGTTDTYSLDNQVTGHWYGDRTENTLLVGLDLQYYKNDSKENPWPNTMGSNMGTINAFDPEYGNFTPADPSLATHALITKKQAGLYAKNQFKFDGRWIATIGARFDEVDVDNENKTANTDEDVSDNHLSMSGGLMYLSESGLSPYISYAESFEVIASIDPLTNKVYKPLEGEQIEAGVKYTPEFIDGYINLAWFNIDQNNGLVSSIDGGSQTQAGKVTSRGVEVDAVAKPMENVSVAFNYTYNDSQYKPSEGAEMTRSPLIPRHMASAQADYNFASLGAEDLTVGGAVRYIGSSVGHTSTGAAMLNIPSYTVWDMRAQYNINNQWQAQLNVNNLFDETYVSSCDYYCYYGEERSVIATLNYRW